MFIVKRLLWSTCEDESPLDLYTDDEIKGLNSDVVL